MATVAEIVAVVHVIDVNIIGLVPVRRPGFRPRINNPEPKTAVLKARASIDHDHGCAVYAEVVSASEVLTEAVWRNAITNITSAIMPRAMFAPPIPCTLTRPDIVGRRMRGIVPVIASVFVRPPVLRLMRIWPVRLLLVLGRTYIMPRFGPRCLVVIRMLLRGLMVVIVTVVAGFVALVMLGTAMVVVIVPVLCVRRRACC